MMSAVYITMHVICSHMDVNHARTRDYIGISGRNTLPFKDSEFRLYLLYTIGKEDPPLKVKRFIEEIRFHEDEKPKMSSEYKVLKKLCPVYYIKKQEPIIHIISPYEFYHDIKDARPLWRQAFVKLDIDEKTENDYRILRNHYENIRPSYRTTTNRSFLEQDRFKQQRELNKSIEKSYKQVRQLEDAINSTNRKNLGLCLTFRGLLAYLLSEREFRKRLENKKGKRKPKERYKEKAAGWRKDLVKRSSTRIHEVIRNSRVIREAPFLRHSELFESLGFGVVDLLLQISAELIDQLHIDADNDHYLLRRATERFLAEFEGYFFDRLRGAVKKRYPLNVVISHGIPLRPDEELESVVKRIANRKSTISTLNEYRKEMALQMKKWLLYDLKEREGTINKSLEMEHALKNEQKSPDS